MLSWLFEFDNGVHAAAEPSQGNIEPLAELAALGEYVLSEALVAEFNEKGVLLKYLFNFRFRN